MASTHANFTRDSGLCFVRGRFDDRVKPPATDALKDSVSIRRESRPTTSCQVSATLPSAPPGATWCAKFCQNWDISKSRESIVLAVGRPGRHRPTAHELVAAAWHSPTTTQRSSGSMPPMVPTPATTGIKAVAVTAPGTCALEPCAPACRCRQRRPKRHSPKTSTVGGCVSHLRNVLDTLAYLRHQTPVVGDHHPVDSWT